MLYCNLVEMKNTFGQKAYGIVRNCLQKTCGTVRNCSELFGRRILHLRERCSSNSISANERKVKGKVYFIFENIKKRRALLAEFC